MANPKPMIMVAFVALLSAFAATARDEPLWMDARIDGKPARMYLDTGAENVWLSRKSVERLGLKLRPVKGGSGSHFFAGTVSGELTATGISWKGRFSVYNAANGMNREDGMIGWPQVRDHIIRFDASTGAFTFLTSVPVALTGWIQLPLEGRLKVLALKAPAAAGGGLILVDTGSSSGVGLPPAAWSDWKANNKLKPRTLTAGYALDVGLMVREQAWADRLVVPGLTLTDAVVEEADKWSLGSAGSQHVATLGLAALKRLDLIVDGKRGVAYLRPKTGKATPMAHNRIGVVFVPDEKSGRLSARVAAGSPAAEAGIANGDLLLALNGCEVKSESGQTDALAALYLAPAGTRSELTLMQGMATRRLAIVSRDILPPGNQW
jgi:PDZ domain/Aspartyl protease